MSPYKKLIIYYFSGTGNSRNVAKWVSNVAEAENIECRLVNIALTDRLSIEAPEKDALVIFVSPIHGFNYPPVMLHYILRFPKGNNKVVLMNTRAGMLIGKFITPGLTGIAFYFSAAILKIKGYSMKSFYPVDLPSNWISVHPGLNDRTIKFLHEKNRERVTLFARKILSGKSDFKALREVQDLLIAPVAVLYYLAGRFFLAKTYFASADCNNCDVCIKGCPVKAIIQVDKRPFWTFKCESCMKCMGNCPKKAIETAHGFIIEYTLVFNLVLIGLFYKYFDLYFFKIDNELLKLAVETVLSISILAVWYRIVHYFLRFRIFERLNVYTSLTKYKFWGKRYKALKDDK
jgi:ferredoxin